jgi:hypothetical protein
LIAVCLLWRHPRPLIIRLAPAAALAITLAHFTLEGYRWQMIPLYVLTSLLALRECFLSQFVANFNIRRMLAI